MCVRDTLLPIRELGAKGIVMGDVAAFLETPSGGKFFWEHGKVVHVTLNNAVYISDGFLPLPLVYSSPDFMAMANNKKICHCMVLSVLECFWVKAAAASVMSAMWDHGVQHLQADKGSGLARFEVLFFFWKEAGLSPSSGNEAPA